jgi:hypothetical protein
MAVQPKAGSGSTARTVRRVRDGTPRSLRRGRPPKEGTAAKALRDVTGCQTDYESARIEEIGIRAQLYRLRVGKLSGELIDRKLLLIELSAQYTAIREIILGSKMTQGEKLDLLKQLSSIPVELAPAQSESEPAPDAEANERI